MLNEFWRKLLDTVESYSYIATFADPNREILAIDTYAYTVERFNTGAPISTTTAFALPIVMDSDSDFVCTYFSACAVATGQTTITANPSISVQISDKSTGRNYFNAPAPCPLIAGQMGFPFLLTSPRVIKPRTTLSVAFTALEAGATFDLFAFVMHGARIFYK